MINASVKSSGSLIEPAVEQKENALRRLMRSLESVLVAYSGGVDSTYLALIATQELGAKALCVTGVSGSLSARERESAFKLAQKFNFNHETVCTEELANPDYQANPTNRCYFCKSELYGKLSPLAVAREIKWIADGANTDDLTDFRPGRQAAAENKVRSPLVEANLSKQEIRELSRKHELPTWDKPASPCLSSRIAYGVPVTIERLGKIERGEQILREFGLRVFRVRSHGDLVRLEIAPDEMERVLQKTTLNQMAEQFRALGFRFVTLDLHGFRSGALNETIKKDEK